ncbi:hypothetical protein OROGR_030012 [Orobanche gracilis]
MAASSSPWSCAVLLLALSTVILQLPVRCLSTEAEVQEDDYIWRRGSSINKWPFVSRGWDEIYVVGEGETLQTISEKCDDPFILEQNPHIHDPDDVFPGLVIKITPLPSSTRLYV